MSQKSLLQANFIAIQTAKKINDAGKNYQPSASEIISVSAYKGFGGIKSVLYPLDIEWSEIEKISAEDLRMEKDIRDFYLYLADNFDNYDQIWDSIKSSILTAFFTPDDIVNQQIENIYRSNHNNIENILDPCAGNGVYVDSCLAFYPEAKIVAVEQDYLSAFILKAKYVNYDNVSIINDSYENVKFKQKFDLITSNIPFGNFKVSPDLDLNYSSDITGKIHNFFFYHSLNLLNNGGALSFITSTGVFNSPSNKSVRVAMSEIANFEDIVTLPNNLFKEVGTEVTSHLVTMIKTDVPNANKNKNFIETIVVDKVTINDYVFQNFNHSFLSHPTIQTNQYGNNEYSYTEDLGILLFKYSAANYQLPGLEITKNAEDLEKNEILVSKGFPFQTFDFLLDEEDHSQDIFLIKDSPDFNIMKESERNSFKNLAVITANYQGKEIPLATFGRSINEDKGRIKNYFINTYVNELGNQYSGSLTSREFITSFQEFIEKLELLSKKHSLFINKKSRIEDADAVNFVDYLDERFNQPKFSQSLQTDFENFSFHKEPAVGMLVLNNMGIPSEIVEIIIDQDVKAYVLEEIKVKGFDHELLTDYLGLYDSYNLLISAERNNLPNVSHYRERLNKTYDSFVTNFGFINEIPSLLAYDSNYLPILKSLEKDKTEIENAQIDLFTPATTSLVWKKADIFDEPVIEQEKLDLNSALAKSFNELGKIDIPFIMEISNSTRNETLDGLSGKIIYNPIVDNYELRSIFFSGDIRKKINEIKRLNNEDHAEIIIQLENIIPAVIPFEAIKLQFGTRWLPLHYLSDFVEKYFETGFDFNFNRNTDTFLVNPKENRSAKYYSYVYDCISNRKIRPEDIISNAFYDQYPLVTYTIEVDGQRITENDDEATKFYKREISNLRREFVSYLQDLSNEKKEALVEMYNDQFNSVVVPDFDNDILDFGEFNLEGLEIKEIYDHQKRSVWKIINNEGGVVDHEVGLGKTFEIIAAAHFGKKLGVFQKPIITGIKANVSDIAKAYRILLPNANILFATEKDYELKNRQIFLNKIRNNNYDCVIMSHDNFEKIPQSLQVEELVLKSELNDVEENLFNVENKNFSKKQLKGLEQRKKTLTANLNAMSSRIRARKDTGVLEFDDLGIDHIIVDESHKFKNLMFQTKHSRVAGLGNQEGSQRANNLLTAIRTIQQNTKTNDYGATFFSGTVISNSLTELYLVQKYMTPSKLKEKNIYNFDAWCSTFAEKSIEFETNMVNKVVAKERFRFFINLPELSLMYNEMSDVMTGDRAGIDRPVKNETLLLGEQTPMQKKFYVKLSNFLQDKNQEPLKLDRPLSLDDRGTAISLLVMDLAYKASLDMRLISSRYPDDPNSKINQLIKNSLETYNKFAEDKGTQIIFCDLGTSKKKLTFEELENNYNKGVFTGIYDDIKYKLMKGGVPENEIAFVQDYNSQKKRATLNDKMNAGEIRYLIGGTENAGVGLNVQQKLSKIYHLSIPWKPSDMDQRNGRGHRKGNLLAKVKNNNTMDIGICATRNTLDNYRIDLIKHKKGFVDQIKDASQSLSRHIDEGSMSQDAGMNIAELQAQLTGDNSLLKLSKIDGNIKEIEQEKLFVLSQNRENTNKISQSEKKIRELTSAKELFIRDLALYNSKVVIDEDGKRVNKPDYLDLTDDATPEQIYSYFIKLVDKSSSMSKYENKVVAKMFGFELIATNDLWNGVQFKITNPKYEKGTTYAINNGKINLESVSACTSYFVRCFDMIDKRLKGSEQNIQQELEKLEVYKLNATKTFDKDEILSSLYQEKENLQETITANQNRDLIEFKIRVLSVDGEDREFKVLNNIAELNYGILNESFGREHSEIGIFATPDLADIFNEIADMESSSIKIFNQNPVNEHEFLKFKISDYDSFYTQFDKVEKKITFSLYDDFNEQIARKIENPLVTLDKKTFYCYGYQAEVISKIISIPTVMDDGRFALVIPSHEMKETMQKLVNEHKMIVNIVNVDIENRNNNNQNLKP